MLYRGLSLGYTSSLNAPTVRHLPRQNAPLASDALLQEYFSLAITAWLTAWLTRACFVDGQLAALHFGILEPCNGGLGLASIGHLHKPEAAWPARLTVGDEIDTPHSAIGFEELPYIL